jgi:hypothetical protein
MASDRIKKQVEDFLRVWRGEWDKQHEPRLQMFPSLAAGDRGAVSPLGGQAVETPKLKGRS